MLIPHKGMKYLLFQKAAGLLRPCDVLLDVGCGLRPQTMVKSKRHVCLEPHGEYADALVAQGYEVIREKAPEGLIKADIIMALDVIEHMEKEDGLKFIDRCMELGKQVVIFTPLGFMPQEETGPVDGWGLQGQEWQRHRSGWLPEEFPGWTHFIDTDFHKGQGAFFAIYDFTDSPVLG